MRQWKPCTANRVIKCLKAYPAFKDTIYTLLFADDQVLLTQEYEDMEFMVRKVLEEKEKWGLKINLEKTFYMGCGGETKDLLKDQKVCIRGCEEFK